MNNREIDKLVAEKVFGQHVHDYTQASAMKWRCQTCNRLDYAGQTTAPHAYSTDIAAAWLVVEKIRTLDELRQVVFCDDIALAAYDDDWAVATIRAGRGHYPDAMMRIIMPTPAAICRAALKAVRVDVTEKDDAHN